MTAHFRWFTVGAARCGRPQGSASRATTPGRPYGFLGRLHPAAIRTRAPFCRARRPRRAVFPHCTSHGTDKSVPYGGCRYCGNKFQSSPEAIPQFIIHHSSFIIKKTARGAVFSYLTLARGLLSCWASSSSTSRVLDTMYPFGVRCQRPFSSGAASSCSRYRCRSSSRGAKGSR